MTQQSNRKSFNSDMVSKNIYWHGGNISTEEREAQMAQKGAVIWFTGLSGSGKSTLAIALEEVLFKKKKYTYVLDGDNIRHGLNKDLGFSEESRKENIRRIAEVARLFQDSGCIIITAFISPFREDRKFARSLLSSNRFLEIFVDTSLETCEKRDTKGLYEKARSGEIPEFTGISSPYEEPDKPELILSTEDHDVNSCVNMIIEKLQASYII